MDESRKSAAPVVAVALLVLLSPVFYVLSIGPAAWLVEKEVVSGERAELFYFPICMAADYSPTAMSLLEWYMELFI
jgi:hypothetical protein